VKQLLEQSFLPTRQYNFAVSYLYHGSRPDDTKMAGHFIFDPPGRTFPEKAQFQGFMEPSRFEGEVFDLEIVGQIPKEIDGTFYRVMPDPQMVPFIQDDPVISRSHCVEAV
jgi:Retinal pigment epithelial membrane protein